MVKHCYLKSEDGSVLVVSLCLLILLTLLGFFIAAISEVEIQLAGNDRLYKDNLYTAEGGALECAQRMQEAAALVPGTAPTTWLIPLASRPTLAQIRDNNHTAWTATSQVSAIDANTRFVAVEEGVSVETSLDMTKTTLHSYTIYGRRYNTGAPQRGRAIVQLGYRKASS
jgi:Tfp pilus assembly protein PilX